MSNYALISWIYFIISIILAIWAIFKKESYGFKMKNKIESMLFCITSLVMHCYGVYSFLYGIENDQSIILFIGITGPLVLALGFVNVFHFKILIDYIFKNFKKKNKKR